MLRKYTKVGKARKGKHGNGNGETNRDRVFEDVSHEAVFDTLSVVLQGENEAWITDTGEI